jgi:hypothetical protein
MADVPLNFENEYYKSLQPTLESKLFNALVLRTGRLY